MGARKGGALAPLEFEKKWRHALLSYTIPSALNKYHIIKWSQKAHFFSFAS